jgi:hypothetical protein
LISIETFSLPVSAHVGIPLAYNLQEGSSQFMMFCLATHWNNRDISK